MLRSRALLAGGLLLALAACGGDDGDDAGDADDGTVSTVGQGITLSVDVPAFGFAEAIPERFSRLGGNVSPPITWSEVPPLTVELALVVDDPDARDFTHWLVAGLDPVAGGFGEGELPAGAVEGRNDFGDIGWGGPSPPEGETHTYVFTLIALGEPSGLEEGFGRDDLDGVLERTLLVSAEHTGVFTG